ncbi:MAG: hypothetical protein ACOC8P_01320 [Dichotomicrobium sp.]
MIESYTVTQVIAAFIGLYMLAGGAGMLAERDVWSKVIEGVADSPALGYLAGIIAFVIGAAIVAVHNRWGTPLEVVVSLIGWAGLIEGMLMLAVRRPFTRFFAELAPSQTIVRVIAGIIIAVGLVLLYAALL